MTTESARGAVRKVFRHYENFSVVSFRQPPRIKEALQNIYAYCRTSDDLADETSDSEKALAALDQWEHQFLNVIEGHVSNSTPPILQALAKTISTFRLPRQPFLDLLTAFRQDQTVFRYHTIDELLNYCRYSANPVGRIVLAVFGYQEEKYYPASDAICTGLQLANFWQDIARDADLGRIYLPLEDLHRFGVNEDDILNKRYSPSFIELLTFQVNRTQEWFEQGGGLTAMVGRDIRWEIEMFRRAGLSVLSGIRHVNYNVFQKRPQITTARKWWIGLTSLLILLRKTVNER
jgi:squalene synthase HpnC